MKMSSEVEGKIIQFIPFVSFVDPSFWHIFTDVKLHVDKLSEKNKQIYGKFTYREDVGPIFQVNGASFNEKPQSELFFINVKGTIINKNTIEEFTSTDKKLLLNTIGENIWETVKRKDWIMKPDSLISFFILSFSDLKKFHYYFWFAFPCPLQPTIYEKKNEQITQTFNNDLINQLETGHRSLEDSQKCFFIVQSKNEHLLVKTLSEVLKSTDDCQSVDFSNIYYGFVDPGIENNPGWPLRILITALVECYPLLLNEDMHFIGLRTNAKGAIDKSRIYTVFVPKDVNIKTENSGWIGWERNDKGLLSPKFANMATSMDPIKLADQSSDLNVQLMKWRLVPELNVDILKTTKCLLVGAGTLGCQVARCLLAWGFRHITFVDSSNVSYSNPTRQTLFDHEDCLHGGKNKADAAAHNLKKILPTVDSRAIKIHIPMPGHPVGESLKEETLSSIKNLKQAVLDNDVIFLLLDTREARWLPTLIAASHGKLVINAALGFDSYLVMRHGVNSLSQSGSSTTIIGSEVLGKTHLYGNQLACYFCSDVTAPGNSVRERTLDQQCTVTRPGVSAIAGALAVELLVSLLQHPLKTNAPAIYNNGSSAAPSDLEGVLGPVPHTIRGFLHSHQTVLPTCVKFKQCVACSDIVIDKYRQEGDDFLFDVFNSGTYLETVTGLNELHVTAEMCEVLALSDDEE